VEGAGSHLKVDGVPAVDGDVAREEVGVLEDPALLGLLVGGVGVVDADGDGDGGADSSASDVPALKAIENVARLPSATARDKALWNSMSTPR
jgi:hypothetical protein